VPRLTGDRFFAAPWDGRAFSLGVALRHRGLYEWDEFRALLIDEIGEAEAGDADSSYYERWLAALERLLLARGVVSTPELDERTAGGVVSTPELDERTAEYAAGERDDDDHTHDD
jgi:nitrile hydratase accessory protein